MLQKDQQEEEEKEEQQKPEEEKETEEQGDKEKVLKQKLDREIEREKTCWAILSCIMCYIWSDKQIRLENIFVANRNFLQIE